MINPGCPEGEELARLIEGKLGPDERRDLLAHVASCPTCLEIVGGSIHTLEAVRLTTELAPVRVWRRWALYGAGALAAAAGIALILLRPFGLSKDELAALPSADRLGTELSGIRGGSALVPWAFSGVPPSYGFVAGERRTTVEFRLGVRIFDVDSAIRAGDRTAAGGALADLVALLSELGTSGDVLADYHSLTQRISEGPPGAIGPALADAERGLLGRLQSPYLALGWWSEAGRMFTGVEKVRCQWPGEARLLIKGFHSRELPPGVATALRTIAETPEDRCHLEETRQQWTSAFTRILRLM
jgi:hypothetical protein